MMYQAGQFPFYSVLDNKAIAVELPYGKVSHFSFSFFENIIIFAIH